MTFILHDEDPFGDSDPFEIYGELYAPLEKRFGLLDEDVLSSPMMMSGMSFCMRRQEGLYVMYEPCHLIETKSREGLKFAIFLRTDLPEAVATDFLTELADWVLENEIGHGDRIDLTDFETGKRLEYRFLHVGLMDLASTRSRSRRKRNALGWPRALDWLNG
jgi:hypothetical protein